MRILSLFSGTGSVDRVCEEFGYEVTSLDIDGRATITQDILTWDYRNQPRGTYALIFASVPCETFSNLRNCWVGRRLKRFGMDNIVTREMLDADMHERGLPLLQRTVEIINYFQPNMWVIENPATSKISRFLRTTPYYDVAYCRYGFGYAKPTRLFTNLKPWTPLKCNHVGRHENNIGARTQGNVCNMDLKYRIPKDLLLSLLTRENISRSKFENIYISYYNEVER